MVGSAVSVSVSAVSALLRSVGLRVTAPRRAVLGWLAEHPHSTAEAIKRGAGERVGSVSHQAVYDVLKVCGERGLVRRIEPAGHPALFERRVGDNHHHLICRGCGDTADIDCTRGAAPCLTPNEDTVSSWARRRSCSGVSAPPAPCDRRASGPPSTRVRGPGHLRKPMFVMRRISSDQREAEPHHHRCRCPGRER